MKTMHEPTLSLRATIRGRELHGYIVITTTLALSMVPDASANYPKYMYYDILASNTFIDTPYICNGLYYAKQTYKTGETVAKNCLTGNNTTSTINPSMNSYKTGNYRYSSTVRTAALDTAGARRDTLGLYGIFLTYRTNARGVATVLMTQNVRLKSDQTVISAPALPPELQITNTGDPYTVSALCAGFWNLSSAPPGVGSTFSTDSDPLLLARPPGAGTRSSQPLLPWT